MHLYNNAAKIFGTEGFLCRRLCRRFIHSDILYQKKSQILRFLVHRHCCKIFLHNHQKWLPFGNYLLFSLMDVVLEPLYPHPTSYMQTECKYVVSHDWWHNLPLSFYACFCHLRPSPISDNFYHSISVSSNELLQIQIAIKYHNYRVFWWFFTNIRFERIKMFH